ncbi:DUF4328 domain-containing protein [Cellulosimicrobium sp. XJ-DQ-B-000]|uniref:DUF4328 domain-containing protein n=1 Tax=Cellulosimicrobium sp. XJ-DQ-B-000 TaxID=3072182 RepID=UPI0028099D51|nr:DUF4328 domain-containing protein [Cellulosimicrobium sp. XJ-DQ-B-000]MDQ8040348.1 DUF4328 domain-containing protein [Cellulosimicrobium sp. XJ-DQ-B-000]
MTHHDPSGVPPYGQPGGPVPGQPSAPGRPVPQYGAYGTAPVPAYGQAAPSPAGPSALTPPSAPVYGQPTAPAYGAYGGGYGYVPRPPVPGGLATGTIALAVAVTAVQVLAWVTSFRAAEEFERAARAGTPSAEVLTGYDAVGLLLLPVQLAAAIVTCLWLWQSRVLAEAVSPAHGHARSRVWVWLGWIVPVVALWFPYQVVRDVRAATVVAPRRGLGWWWAGWILWSVATNVATQLTTLSSAGAAGTFALLPVAETVGTAGVVLALVLWVRTVREITAGQRAATGVDAR